jgi:hypothetical protein
MKITSNNKHDNCKMICYVHPWETHYAKLLCKKHNVFVQWIGKKDVPKLSAMGVQVKRKVRLLDTYKKKKKA